MLYVLGTISSAHTYILINLAGSSPVLSTILTNTIHMKFDPTKFNTATVVARAAPGVAHEFKTKYIDRRWYASNGTKKYLIVNSNIEKTVSTKEIVLYSLPTNKHHDPWTERKVVMDLDEKKINALNESWSKLCPDMTIKIAIINDKTCLI